MDEPRVPSDQAVEAFRQDAKAEYYAILDVITALMGAQPRPERRPLPSRVEACEAHGHRRFRHRQGLDRASPLSILDIPGPRGSPARSRSLPRRTRLLPAGLGVARSR